MINFLMIMQNKICIFIHIFHINNSDLIDEIYNFSLIILYFDVIMFNFPFCFNYHFFFNFFIYFSFTKYIPLNYL